MKIPMDGGIWLRENAVKEMEKRSVKDTKAACECEST